MLQIGRLCVILAIALMPGWAIAAPVLERVVIVMRHGVRAPTATPAELAKFASAPWPDWPVGPGELTPHGADGAQLLGVWLRSHFSGLMTGAECKGTVSVWADGKDERTIDTGRALMTGFGPGCAAAVAHGKVGATDPVFSALGSGVCPVAQEEAKPILKAIQMSMSGLSPAYAQGLETLRDVLRPPGCSGAAAKTACWLDGINTIHLSAKGAKITGPLATGATLAESLSLEYQQGMQGDALGWGRLSETTLDRVMAIHNLYSAMVRRNPVVAGHNGAVLARRVLAALGAEQGPTIAIFVGHDTNLDNMAGIFGLDWAHPGQPDATPPDGMLVFERWRDGGGEPQVRIAFVYQTAQQLRDLLPLTNGQGPGISPVTSSSCAGGTCAMPVLQGLADRRIPKSCAAHG